MLEIKKTWSHWLSLILIIIVALVLRFFWLSEAPTGALIDEAHFGYLAWSIIETGKDEHSIPFPLNFKGFGDDKLPLQVYLTVPFVKIFGLSTATIRYPSIIAGTLLVLVMYLLAKRLGLGRDLSLLTAFITALSPWTFILSRFGFESNLALFFFTLGIYFAISFVQDKTTVQLVFTALSLAMTWYSYIAYRPISIVLVLCLLGLFWKNNLLKKKIIGILLGVFIITILPLFSPSVVGNNSTRLNQVGIFSDPILALEVNEFRNFCSSKVPVQTFCFAVSNKYTVTLRILIARFFDVYSPDFLATKGERTEKFLTVADFGQFFSVLYPLFLLGIAALLFQTKFTKKQDLLLFFLLICGLLITPIPSVLAGDPQKVRISALFPFVALTIVVGARTGLRYLSDKKMLRYACSIAFFGLLTLQIFQFYFSWFSVHSLKNGYMYQSYLPKLFSYLKNQSPNTKVVIRPFFSDPLMFYAFYTHMHPAEYQKLAVLGEKEASGFQHTVELGNISAQEVSLGEVGCKAIAKNERTLFISQEKIEAAKIVYTIYSENGVDARVFVYDAAPSVDPKNCERTGI